PLHPPEVRNKRNERHKAIKPTEQRARKRHTTTTSRNTAAASPESLRPMIRNRRTKRNAETRMK
ncbi:MAG: hypothetical protein ACREMP_06605, partial [Candidatus Tyrphobacter sp.]